MTVVDLTEDDDASEDDMPVACIVDFSTIRWTTGRGIGGADELSKCQILKAMGSAVRFKEALRNGWINCNMFTFMK